MLHWIVDNATFLYVLLGFLTAVPLVLWWTSRRSELLYAAAVMLGLILLVWLLSLYIVTDRIQLRRAVDEMAGAIGDNKPDVVVRHLSEKFRYGGLTKQNARRRIAAAIRVYGLEYINIANFEIGNIDSANGYAKVSFRARVDHADGSHLFLCRTEFFKEYGHWRMRTFKLFNPVANTNQELRITLP